MPRPVRRAHDASFCRPDAGFWSRLLLCCRRVEKRQLVALVVDGSALPCVMPDIEVIAKIVTYYERWQVRPLNGLQTLPAL